MLAKCSVLIAPSAYRLTCGSSVPTSGLLGEVISGFGLKTIPTVPGKSSI